MGFLHVCQAGLELLTSGDPLISAPQSAGIISMSHCAWPQAISLIHQLDQVATPAPSWTLGISQFRTKPAANSSSGCNEETHDTATQSFFPTGRQLQGLFFLVVA